MKGRKKSPQSYFFSLPPTTGKKYLRQALKMTSEWHDHGCLQQYIRQLTIQFQLTQGNTDSSYAQNQRLLNKTSKYNVQFCIYKKKISYFMLFSTVSYPRTLTMHIFTIQNTEDGTDTYSRRTDTYSKIKNFTYITKWNVFTFLCKKRHFCHMSTFREKCYYGKSETKCSFLKWESRSHLFS